MSTMSMIVLPLTSPTPDTNHGLKYSNFLINFHKAQWFMMLDVAMENTSGSTKNYTW